MVFHVLNRGNDRREIFEADGDFEAFLRVMRATSSRLQGEFQTEAFGDALLPFVRTEWPAACDRDANRFQLALGLRRVDPGHPILRLCQRPA